MVPLRDTPGGARGFRCVGPDADSGRVSPAVLGAPQRRPMPADVPPQPMMVLLPAPSGGNCAPTIAQSRTPGRRGSCFRARLHLFWYCFQLGSLEHIVSIWMGPATSVGVEGSFCKAAPGVMRYPSCHSLVSKRPRVVGRGSQFNSPACPAGSLRNARIGRLRSRVLRL